MSTEHSRHSSKPDPEDALKGTDYLKALWAHLNRSPAAIEWDESIQAREQVTDFKTWNQMKNTTDFPSVDDFDPFGGIYDPVSEFEQ